MNHDNMLVNERFEEKFALYAVNDELLLVVFPFTTRHSKVIDGQVPCTRTKDLCNSFSKRWTHLSQSFLPVRGYIRVPVHVRWMTFVTQM